MNIVKFYNQQKEYNNQLIIDPDINMERISSKKYLSLNVKLGALAAETHCYKYWVDNNPDTSMDNIFDKYIECLSFIVTLGIDKNYTDISEIKVVPNDYSLSDQFLNLYVDLNDMIISSSRDHYQTLFEDFISLGISLGFSQSKIESGFMNNPEHCHLSL